MLVNTQKNAWPAELLQHFVPFGGVTWLVLLKDFLWCVQVSAYCSIPAYLDDSQNQSYR